MGISFMAQKAPAGLAEGTPEWRAALYISGEDITVDVNMARGGMLLKLLGYSTARAAGEADPAEFLARIARARAEKLAWAYETWGEWTVPGYFETRLDQLEVVAQDARARGGEVVWA